MRFAIQFSESAKDDLNYFSAHEQRIILAGIRRNLSDDADGESKKRKKLRTNEIAAWELKLGKYRVFYDIGNGVTVKVIAIGYKDHNALFIKGERVEL
ncbi:MAG: type II toxin-antitoxin system RelE family toxin [Blastocatellia bacterium]